MLFLVCSVVLSTGAWDCGKNPVGLPIVEAVAIVYASNDQLVYKPGMLRSPYTIWPADKPTPDKSPLFTNKDK